MITTTATMVVLDVFVQLETQQNRAFSDVGAVDRPGEPLVFHFLLHRLRFDFSDLFRRPDERDRRDESRQFVDGKKRFFHQGVPGDPRMVRVREDRPDEHLVVAPLPQDLRAAHRVVVRRGIALVIEVVEQPRDAPERLVFVETARVPPHRRLHRQGVFDQIFALRVFRQEGIRLVPGGY